MADICACLGGDCPMKEDCYRFTCVKSEWLQSYFREIPFRVEAGRLTCKYFWCSDETDPSMDFVNN